MKKRLSRILAGAWQALQPKPAPRDPLVQPLLDALSDSQVSEAAARREYVARAHELAEARQMAGPGPWLPGELTRSLNEGASPQKFLGLRETIPISSMGAYGDIELALQNVEWRREINLTWLEFSRWGIQQIMLICRLYYIKNPVVRRLIDVCADYVFARGVEISSPDKAANDVLKEFFEENKTTLGQHALADLERRKDYDGNLFFCFFADTDATGTVKVRTIDALEIQDIVSDPEDSTKPQYYRRVWVKKIFDPSNGQMASKADEVWYPALGYDPPAKPQTINGKQVSWDTPVYHRKAGAIATWQWGCPRAYPMIDWARSVKDFLTACATVKQALAQIAMTLTTKGGQQALEGAKTQIQTQVGPGGGQSLWDSNPPAVHGAIFASGPGTKLEAFKTQGSGGNPEEVRQYKLQCCMVAGVPETFLADVATGNLATATSLDRPTETGFLSKQEAWVEDLTVISKYVLSVSSKAAGGKLREAHAGAELKIIEMRRQRGEAGFVYFPLKEADKKNGKKTTIEVKVSFPAIREGDIPAQVKAVVEAMTLDNKGGQIVGIDEKEAVRKLNELLDIADGDELLEKMYPKTYDPDRTKEELDDPIGKALPMPGGQPQLPGGKQIKPEDRPVSVEALRTAAQRLLRGIKVLEAKGEDAHINGH